MDIDFTNTSILKNIYYFGTLCKNSYSSSFQNSIKISNEKGLDCNIYFCEKNKYLFIIFSGTNEKKDWYANLNFKKFYFCKNMYIHNGVYQMYHLSSKEIFNKIQQFQFKKLIITGHSLGGYLAQAMAYDLFFNYQIHSSVFIFGSALIISKEMQKFLWKNNILIFEIYLQKDIVPKILKWFYPSYYSIKIKIQNKNKNCFSIINNHIMKSYLESLIFIF